jgi:hypothetical protein
MPKVSTNQTGSIMDFAASTAGEYRLIIFLLVFIIQKWI